jgi:hypothetical protein
MPVKIVQNSLSQEKLLAKNVILMSYDNPYSLENYIQSYYSPSSSAKSEIYEELGAIRASLNIEI